MEKTCGKCGFLNDRASSDHYAECPRCGAIYSRVEAQALKREPVAAPPKTPSKTHARKVAIAVFLFGVLAAFNIITIKSNSSADQQAHPQRPHFGPTPKAKAEAAPPTPVCAADDATCIGTRELSNAEPPCRDAVTRLLAYRSEWKDGIWEDKFDRVGWYEPTETLIFHGDKLEAQNGFGAWQKLSYFCVWNHKERRVIKAGINSA